MGFDTVRPCSLTKIFNPEKTQSQVAPALGSRSAPPPISHWRARHPNHEGARFGDAAPVPILTPKGPCQTRRMSRLVSRCSHRRHPTHAASHVVTQSLRHRGTRLLCPIATTGAATLPTEGSASAMPSQPRSVVGADKVPKLAHSTLP